MYHILEHFLDLKHFPFHTYFYLTLLPQRHTASHSKHHFKGNILSLFGEFSQYDDFASNQTNLNLLNPTIWMKTTTTFKTLSLLSFTN